MNEIAAKSPSFDINKNSSTIFEQYSYVKNYCSTEKIEVKHMRIGERWVEIFKHMEAEHVPYTEFALIIEFALCLSGSNASGTCIFTCEKYLDIRLCISPNFYFEIDFVCKIEY